MRTFATCSRCLLLSSDTDRPLLPYSNMVGYPGATVTMDLPANTSYIILNGTVGPDQGTVTFRFEPTQPTYYPAQLDTNHSDSTIVGPLLFTPLAPTIRYSLIIGATGKGPIGLTTVSVFSSLL